MYAIAVVPNLALPLTVFLGKNLSLLNFGFITAHMGTYFRH